jgi:hypothetical protein
MMGGMQVEVLDEAVELLEKADADLEPELLTAAQARRLMGLYARAQRLVAFGIASLSRKLDDASSVAGTSVGKARAVVATGKVLASSTELSAALQHGDISRDQAAQIASAEESAPGAAKQLVPIAQHKSFHELKDEARRVKLEAEQHRDLMWPMPDQLRGRRARVDPRRARRGVQDPRRGPGGPRGGARHRPGRLHQRGCLRRQGPAPLQALDPQLQHGEDRTRSPRRQAPAPGCRALTPLYDAEP